MSRAVRIAAGQGFWGDWLEAPVRQVEGGPIDYLMLDYLAEVTMSILQKLKSRDPSAGYARDFVALIDRILPTLLDRDIRVTSNAGGVNPRACARAILDNARSRKRDVAVGLVTGDDITDRLDDLLARGTRMDNMDTGEPLETIRDRVQAANVYIGMAPIVEALEHGARIVVTGRVTDTALVLGPLFHEFGWDPENADLVSAGTVAGHILECGAQSSGGNYQRDWRKSRHLEDVGFPIVEVSEDGSFVVTKHPGTGGLVTPASVTEQLVYEIGDPERYLTADGVADFTSLTVRRAGRDRVRVSGARGGPPTDSYKASIAYSWGWKAVGTLVYSWPDAYDKAREADRIIRKRMDALGLVFEKVHTEFVGVDATHGRLAGPPDPDIPEVMLRVGVRARERAPVERFTREMAPLVLNGPPGVTGYGYRPDVKEIVAFWPALLPRAEVDPHVTVDVLSA